MLMRRPLLCRSRTGYPLSFHSSGSEAIPPILQRSLPSSLLPSLPLIRERLCVPSLSVPPAFGFLPPASSWTPCSSCESGRPTTPQSSLGASYQPRLSVSGQCAVLAFIHVREAGCTHTTESRSPEGSKGLRDCLVEGGSNPSTACGPLASRMPWDCSPLRPAKLSTRNGAVYSTPRYVPFLN